MHRTFISTIVAAAITITGISATMAQAGEYRRPVYQPQQKSQGGNEAVAAALAGIATLFIIGKTIERNRSPRETVIVPAPAPRHIAKPQKHKSHAKRHHTHRHHTRRHGNVRHHWHTHRNGARHKHAHGPRHHRYHN